MQRFRQQIRIRESGVLLGRPAQSNRRSPPWPSRLCRAHYTRVCGSMQDAAQRHGGSPGRQARGNDSACRCRTRWALGGLRGTRKAAGQNTLLPGACSNGSRRALAGSPACSLLIESFQAEPHLCEERIEVQGSFVHTDGGLGIAPSLKQVSPFECDLSVVPIADPRYLR